jgi:alpha-ketoglutarate-dependent taurine dioxygenase
MLYQTIEVRKLNPVIGAEISGIDLSRDLGNQQFEEVHDALMENLVIFFRDQTITVEQHKALAGVSANCTCIRMRRRSSPIIPKFW